MSDRNFKIIVLAASLSFVSRGAYGAGTSSASFLRIGWGARAAAMGEAFTGAADGIEALYWNPAGLTSVKRLQESFGHNKWVDGVSVEHLAFAFRRPGASYVLGAGLGYLNTGDIDRADKHGNALGYYSASDTALIFSYARQWKKGLQAGGNFKVISERIENSSGKAFAVDAGLLYDFKPGMKLGATLKNLGTGLSMGGQGCSLPLSLRAGLAWQYSKNMLLTSDFHFYMDDSFGLNFGSEYLYPSKVGGLTLLLRAGFKTSGMGYLGALSAVSLGFGAEKGNTTVDYAINPAGVFGLTHRLELKLKFDSFSSGKSQEAEKAEQKIRENPQAVYEETLSWLDSRIESEKLPPDQQAVILEKVIEKFSPFGVDVSTAAARLGQLKNGGQ